MGQKLVRYLFLLFSSFIVLIACNNSSKTTQEIIKINPEFGNYLQAYTSGIISKISSIQIVLKKPINEDIPLNKELDLELFEFSPKIDGKLYRINERTLEFTPNEYLTSNTKYKVDFSLGKVTDVPKDLENFTFQFETKIQSFRLEYDGITAYNYDDLTREKLDGRLFLSDLADSSKVTKLLSASQNGSDKEINYQQLSPLSYHFTVENISRGQKTSTLLFSWNGIPIDSKKKGDRKFEIPSLADFKIVTVKPILGSQQGIEILFSDPILKKQDLRGLIELEGSSNPSFSIEGHSVKVFPKRKMSGVREIKIHHGIKNVASYKLKEERIAKISFSEVKPNVELLSSGVILPDVNGLNLAFAATNLEAVDVVVSKIFSDNVLQHLQANQLNGTYQFKRVGKEVFRNKITLDSKGEFDLSKRNVFSLNLDELIQVDQGAIYKVELRFKKDYALCSCLKGGKNDLQTIQFKYEESEWSEADWGSDYYYYDEYEDEYWEGDYSYRERGDPCKSSYYYNRTVTQSIFASNFGIIAKAGHDKTMNLFVTDIRTAEPISDVTVEFYDYQQQKIGEGKTDSKGFIAKKLDIKPFVVIAKSGKERGYLKLKDSDANSMSKFEVQGATLQKGVKGLIYGERGVWRPGDTLFLSFILEDKRALLPSSFPVKFTLSNPKGVIVDRQVSTQSVNGFYNFTTKTETEAETGNYLAKVSIGNRIFQKYLKVETIKPNRLKVQLTVGEDNLMKKDQQSGNVEVKWLHGAVAKNLRTQISLKLSKASTKFKGFSRYSFENPTKKVDSEEQTILDKKVDADGFAQFDAGIEMSNEAPGVLNAQFTTKVFEAGGGYSINQTFAKYSPFKSYAGVSVPKGKLYRNTLSNHKDHEFKIASVTDEGKALPNNSIEVNVYKLNWRWWYDNYDRDFSYYLSKESTVPLYTKVIKTNSKGVGKFSFGKSKRWGRYFVLIKDRKSGHSAGQIFYMDSPYWARSNRKDQENSTMLNFSTDKENYLVGESIKVSFPSPGEGKALISIESGTKIIRSFWHSTTKGETKLEIEVTPEMAPNVFVHITLVQPYLNKKNDHPIRMYGIVPVTVKDPETILTPLLDMPKVFRPETITKIKVSEKRGKPMTYTLAIVDEGILDLTNFKSTNPWNHFYAREALGIKTWDMYDDVIGAFTGKLQKILAVGGDGSATKNPSKARRFKPMVRFLDPITLSAGETNTHSISIPNYVGSVRVMLIAGQNLAYGKEDIAVPVRSPLMVLGNLPRVLGPEEEISLPATVFAMEKQIKNVKVTLETNDLIQVIGKKTKNISFSKTGEKMINFPVKISNKLGIGKIKLIAKSGKETSTYEIEIDVRSPNPNVKTVYTAQINAGESWKQVFDQVVVDGTQKSTLEISTFPAINLQKRLDYLIQYPHGCVEQTTSSVFPQLFLDEFLSLSNEKKEKIQENINAGIARLTTFQIPNGSFSYWPGNRHASSWGTNYAGHFLLEAEKKGYYYPAQIKQNWIQYQSSQAKDWSSTSYRHSYDVKTQSYRLYTLALAGSPEIGAMNRLKERKSLPKAAIWHLASAYSLIGQSAVARNLILNTDDFVADYRELSYTYGSSARDMAMILESKTLLRMNESSSDLAIRIAKQLGENRWMSTQTTAYCLLGLAKYFKTTPLASKIDVSYKINGKDAKLSGKEKIAQANLQVSSDKSDNKLSVQNNSSGMVFASLITEGIPIKDSRAASASKLKMTVRYKTLDGKDIDPTFIEHGTDFIASIDVFNPLTNSITLNEMALTQIFPSGWEIYNDRLFGSGNTDKKNFDYRDFRDDRVFTYYRLRAGESKTFKIKLNASYKGKFYLPGVFTEAMYDNTYNAFNPGRWSVVGEKETH